MIISQSKRRLARWLLNTLLLSFPLAGCSTLPSSGPTAAQISRRARDPRELLNFEIVKLDAAAIDALNERQVRQIASAASLASFVGPEAPVALGPGDVLNVSIYEVGVGLFGSARPATEVFDPSAHGERFPDLIVSETGRIHLPYIGSLEVAGHTPAEVEAEINQRLAGKSQNPQAIVTVSKNVSRSTFVLGDAARPGRYDLSFQGERLLDAIATAGGSAASAEDTLVRFERGGRLVDQRLGLITAGSPDDVVLQPGDRIQLIKRPRSYTVFGAVNKVSQVAFETGALSLAEALARVQGPNDAAADPTAIFIFRYDAPLSAGAGGKPVIYRLNLLEPASYFLSQRFAMQDKDVLFIANAAANQPSKLISVLNQLFSPFVTARAISK